MNFSPRIGVLLRADNGGLGTMSRDFFKFFPSKGLIIEHGSFTTFKDRFPNVPSVDSAKITREVVDDFLKDIDVLVSFETFYSEFFIERAKKLGVKTVLVPMYEFLREQHQKPTAYLCPSIMEAQITGGQYIPWPVDTDAISFLERTKASTFVHNAGHGGVLGRNGTELFIEATKYVTSDVSFELRTQFPLSVEPEKLSRIRVIEGNLKDNATLFTRGDVLVHPHKFNGLSLPVNEALASGMPMITTKMFPFTTWLSPSFMVEPYETRKTTLSREITMYLLKPQDIAQRIDEMAAINISSLSKEARQLVEARSWKTLLPEYTKFFNSL